MRMHLWIGAATVAIPLCFVDESLAGTQENSMVLGVGTLPCSQWTAHGQTAPDAYIMKSWVLGYVSAYNFLYWPDGDITSGTNEAGIVISLDNYCAAHPSDTIGIATTSLLVDLAARNPQGGKTR